MKFDLIILHIDSLIITEIDDLNYLIKIADLLNDVQVNCNYQYEDWDDILILDLESLLLESLQKSMTIPASLKLRGYNANKDTQLPIPKPISEALVPMPEPILTAVNSPPALNTDK